MLQQPVLITRKARFWPEVPHDIVIFPSPPAAPSPSNPVTLITMLIGVMGMVIAGLLFTLLSNASASFALIFMAMSGIAAIGGGVGYVFQKRQANRDISYLLQAYRSEIEQASKRLALLQQKEQQARIDLDPPFILPSMPVSCYDQLQITPLSRRSIDTQDIALWSRRPDDQDFLSVRIGMGVQHATYTIQLPRNEAIALPTKFDEDTARACSLAESYTSIHAPATVKLNKHGPVALISPPSVTGLAITRELLHTMICQLAYHHSPEDVRIIVMAPEAQRSQWQCISNLPHSNISGLSQLEENRRVDHSRSVAIGPEAIMESLPLISRELSRRELLLGDERRAGTTMLPHLIIVVDHFDPADLDPPPSQIPMMMFHQHNASSIVTTNRQRLNETPLLRPEMTLALTRGAQLGVSVLCICSSKANVPTTSGITIVLDTPEQSPFSSLPAPTSRAFMMQAQPAALSGPSGQPTPSAAAPLYPSYNITNLAVMQPSQPSFTSDDYASTGTLSNCQAQVYFMQPDPPPAVTCTLIDTAPLRERETFALKMQHLRPASTKRPQLRTQVDVRKLFDPPLDITSYNPDTLWSESLQRQVQKPSQHGGKDTFLRIPIGLKVGDEVQYLDFLKDGPHGLLIGQTGSGKSELLQTIIMATALLYHPTQVTFLLIDYKAGLALEPFRFLPHTIGFLSNVSSQALIQRFITMLRAEALRREILKTRGKTVPHLVIIIDEFAEMAKKTETVLDELFTITRVGRELGMHLLLAAQRPEGIIGNKVRDYVQYRLCLRAASPEDSREVIGRVDAANLPASIPGRGYLLHGDNQLDLFQAARVTLPV